MAAQTQRSTQPAAFCHACSSKNLVVPALLAVVCLLSCAAAPCAAQTTNEYVDWLDQSPSPEFRAATVVTNLWLAAFALCSALFGILGAVVAVQWPNPRILCYKTSYSDMPSSSTRSCCSLYSLNLAFCVFWLLVFAIMVIARDVIRIVACLCFCIMHTSVVVVFRMKFKRFGRPERSFTPPDMVTSSSMTGMGSSGGHRPAVGIPIYSIPMTTVVIGGPASEQQAAAGGAGGTGGIGAGGSSSYNWYDASCVQPPAQQPGMYGMPTPSAAAAVGPFAVPVASSGVTYPPQPGSSYGGMYSSPYPQPLPAPAPATHPAAPAIGLPTGAGAAAAAAAGPTGAAGETAAAAPTPGLTPRQ